MKNTESCSLKEEYEFPSQGVHLPHFLPTGQVKDFPRLPMAAGILYSNVKCGLFLNKLSRDTCSRSKQLWGVCLFVCFPLSQTSQEAENKPRRPRWVSFAGIGAFSSFLPSFPVTDRARVSPCSRSGAISFAVTPTRLWDVNRANVIRIRRVVAGDRRSFCKAEVWGYWCDRGWFSYNASPLLSAGSGRHSHLALGFL